MRAGDRPEDGDQNDEHGAGGLKPWLGRSRTPNGLRITDSAPFFSRQARVIKPDTSLLVRDVLAANPHGLDDVSKTPPTDSSAAHPSGSPPATAAAEPAPAPAPAPLRTPLRQGVDRSGLRHLRIPRTHGRRGAP